MWASEQASWGIFEGFGCYCAPLPTGQWQWIVYAGGFGTECVALGFVDSLDEAKAAAVEAAKRAKREVTP